MQMDLRPQAPILGHGLERACCPPAPSVRGIVRNRGIWTLALFWHALVAWAGGSGLNVVVVVNQNSTNSVQLGNDYCEQRGVPAQNLFRMTGWQGGAISWSKADFESDLRDPLLAMLAASGLTNQVQYVLLSMDIPYRVEDGSSGNSTTSALFYGFKTNEPAPGPGLPDSCSLPDMSSNSFAFSELPFSMATPNTAPTNSYLAFMLTDTNLTAAQAILDRALAGDASFPTQAVYLEKTSDSARNVRFFSFDNAVFDSRILGGPSLVRINSDSTSFNQIRGLLTGLANLGLGPNTFVPGGLGDSLTSYAGDLFENTGQSTLLSFLNAGSVASYGTVIEPCNYPQKFPDPLALFYQTRGFAAGEAYYLSVANPYQGLFVGEPLCAPFAETGQAAWTDLTNGTVLRGLASLPPALFSAAAGNLPLDQVDLYVDGSLTRTLTNLPPSAGNEFSLTLNGSAVGFTVPPGATLLSLAEGLADAVNAQSNSLKVAAAAVGDRVEFQGLDPLVLGGNILLSATTMPGTAPALTTMVTAAQPGFLDTTATGYTMLTVSNDTVQGDWLELQVTQTNGNQISVGVTNSTADTNVAHLCQALLDAVNRAPALQGPDGILGGELYPDVHLAQFVLYARSAGWPAAQAQVSLRASADLTVTPSGPQPLQDNLSDLRPRDYLSVGEGATELAVPLAWNTTQVPDGFHELTLVAYEGTSVRTQTRVSRTVLVQNTTLQAGLVPQIAGTNITLDAPFDIAITPNTNAIASIDLFSTGGRIGTVSNQSSATFPVPSSLLGVGLHPFYGLVTDTAANRFRTRTVWIRIVPSLGLSISAAPMTLLWNASPGVAYDVLVSTDLAAGFETAATVTATGNSVQWPIPSGSQRAFYRVRLAAN